MKTIQKNILLFAALVMTSILMIALVPNQQMIQVSAKTASGNTKKTASGNTKKKGEDIGKIERENAERAAQARAEEEAKRKANKVILSSGAEIQSSLPTAAVLTQHSVVAITPANIMNAAAGAQGNQFVQMTVFESMAAQSPAAWACLQAAANAYAGAELDNSIVQLNMSIVTPGQALAPIPAESGATVTLVFQLRSGMPAGKQAAIARVVEGGATTVHMDEDADPKTVTVTVPAGNAAYLLFWC